MSAFVNKKELAKIMDVSLPTLDRLIDRYDDFPIEQKGGNGQDYSFHAKEVKTFLDGQRALEEKSLADRADLLLDLNIALPGHEDGGTGITPNQELSLVRAERERRKLQRESGLLVDIASIRQLMTPVFVNLGQFMTNVPGRLGKRFNLPAEVVDAMSDEMADELRRVVAKLQDDLTTEHDKEKPARATGN